jgi:hypothetical protein
MKVSHACVLLLACAHSGESGRQLLPWWPLLGLTFVRKCHILHTSLTLSPPSSPAAFAGRATLAAGKQQVAFPPPPSVVPAPPVEPIPVPGASPATSFTTPGLMFGLNIAGYNAAAFTPALQTTLCNAITAASGITGACA